MPGIDLRVQDIVAIFQRVACWSVSVSESILIIFIIIAGFRIMAAGGNAERYTAAKKNFQYVLIGALVILGVSVIISTVAAAVGSSLRIVPFTCR